MRTVWLILGLAVTSQPVSTEGDGDNAEDVIEEVLDLGMLVFGGVVGQTNFNKQLERDLLKKYNPRHRPVLKEATTVKVMVYLSIMNVENVNELEQTMTVHGNLWAVWNDEYLVWKPSEYNDTSSLTIDTWKIWQPALALYNSAQATAWHLYMHGTPAFVTNEGRVWASGTFSFQVTCKFDFSDWPYDEQECPIVIADWVYDLSRVNLSDPMDNMKWGNPLVRLSYDPTGQKEKKHVAGWEVRDTWRRHCYWGPSGCKEELPPGQPSWYWSLLEFGVAIKRHAPYYGVSIVCPLILTAGLNCLTFWFVTPSVALALNVLSFLMQTLYGLNLLRDVPPGSGNVPKIVKLYGLNLLITGISLLLHSVLEYFLKVFPSDMKLPINIKISDIPTSQLRKFFQTEGLSFDPQLLLNPDVQFEDPAEFHSPLSTLGSSQALQEPSPEETSIPMENTEGTLVSLDSDPRETSSPIVDQPPPVEQPQEKSSLSPSEFLFLLRRATFVVIVIVYVICIPFAFF